MIDYGYGVSFGTIDGIEEEARQWRNDKAIYDYCRQTGLIDVHQQAKWVTSVSADPSIAMFSIHATITCTCESGIQEAEQVIGVAGLTNIHHIHRGAEISLYVAKPYHKQIDRKTPRAIIKTLAAVAFEMYNLNRIFGETYDTNLSELVNLKDLGFVTEGTLRETYFKNGKYINSVIQSLLRSDYDKLKEGWK
jgi:hypothetical protein